MANNLPMANQIRAIRKSKDVTLEQLAERTGLSPSFLSRMESAKRGLRLENALRVAKALGSEISEITDEFAQDDIIEIERRYEQALSKVRSERGEASLSELEASMDSTLPSPSGDVPNLNIRGGLGIGSVEEIARNDAGHFYGDQVNGFWSFPEVVKAGWRNMPHVYAVPVVGDSMDPTLTSGSYVFIDMTHTIPSPEDIYACDFGDGLAIKRLQLVPRSDKIKIISDNERYADHELLREDVRVYGRVVAWFQWRG